MISALWYQLALTKNIATFNSEHDTRSEFDYPHLWDYIGIKNIFVGVFSENSSFKFNTCRCHTSKDIAPEISNPHDVFLGISTLLPSLANPHGHFFSVGKHSQ